MEGYLYDNVRPSEKKTRAALGGWAAETKTHGEKDGIVWKVPEIIITTKIF